MVIKLYTWRFLSQRSKRLNSMIAVRLRFHSLELNPPRCERTWMVGGASRRSCFARSCWNFWKDALSPCSFNAFLSLYLELEVSGMIREIYEDTGNILLNHADGIGAVLAWTHGRVGFVAKGAFLVLFNVFCSLLEQIQYLFLNLVLTRHRGVSYYSSLLFAFGPVWVASLRQRLFRWMPSCIEELRKSL